MPKSAQVSFINSATTEAGMRLGSDGDFVKETLLYYCVRAIRPLLGAIYSVSHKKTQLDCDVHALYFQTLANFIFCMRT